MTPKSRPARQWESNMAFLARLHTDERREAAAKTPSGANAPYKIFKSGGEWVVKNNTGEVKARFKDRDKALAYLRALYVNVKGAPKRADKTKFTGKAKQRIKK